MTIFSGKVVRARFEESEAILTGASLMAMLARTVPILAMQTPCNHVLYSAACGADPTACRDLVSVTSVSGATVVSNGFALRPDQWFRGGRLETASGETRFIVGHQGNTVTLISPMPGSFVVGPGQGLLGLRPPRGHLPEQVRQPRQPPGLVAPAGPQSLHREDRLMAFWILALVYIVGTVLYDVLRPKPKFDAPTPSSLGDFQFPTIGEGRSIPVVWGTCKLSGPMVTWYGDLQVQAITKEVKTGLFSSDDDHHWLPLLPRRPAGPVQRRGRRRPADPLRRPGAPRGLSPRRRRDPDPHQRAELLRRRGIRRRRRGQHLRLPRDGYPAGRHLPPGPPGRQPARLAARLLRRVPACLSGD